MRRKNQNMHKLEAQIFYLFAFIPESPGVVLPFLIPLLIGLPCYVLTRNVRMQPHLGQHLLEIIYEKFSSFVRSVTGDAHAHELTPVLGTIFVFIATSNLMGLVPGLKSPTSLFSNCLGMGLIIFFLTHWLGFRKQGLHYFKHFWGDIWWMGPLMFPIHLIGELARPVSLTLRLFGNIMGEDVVILVLTIYIFPLIVPIPMLMMAIFTSFLQALVFTILSGIYLSGAMDSQGH